MFVCVCVCVYENVRLRELGGLCCVLMLVCVLCYFFPSVENSVYEYPHSRR